MDPPWVRHFFLLQSMISRGLSVTVPSLKISMLSRYTKRQCCNSDFGLKKIECKSCIKGTGFCLIRCTLLLALLVNNYFRCFSSPIYPFMTQLSLVFSTGLKFNSRIFVSSFQAFGGIESKKPPELP